MPSRAATPPLSLIIPTLNEEANIEPLLARLAQTFLDAGLTGEVIFIDDRSKDKTRDVIARLAPTYASVFRVSCHLKQGRRGKAFSLIEGFAHAETDIVGILDADLQYPPEALAGMVEKLSEYDIVVANRVTRDTSWVRSFLSRAFVFFFAKLLHGLHCDTQSGMKVFRRKILSEVRLNPTRWTFDLEFLLSARNYGYTIGTVDISFAERQHGASKLNPLLALFEIGWNALLIKWRGYEPKHIPSDDSTPGMIGAGVAHNRQRFVTHTTLEHHTSALNTFAPWQRNLALTVLAVIFFGLFVDPLHTGIAVVGVLTAIYFFDTLFNLYLVAKSLRQPPELSSTEEERAALDPNLLPVYSVLCPLYKEAHMLPTFVKAMQALDWPKAKLDIMLLLEENDPETIAAAQAMNLPSYVRIVVVPHSAPKTKPKACNYGLAYARGEYVVIYDAEDIPDPAQLKKAYLGFQKSDPSVRCLQAKLNYFNPHQNLLTRLFTAEYSLWFDVILPGLQSINTSIPLGGTSNHFRTADLLELEGWDPFNVTEDCDLGVRIFKRGFRTAIIDSVTLEEANSDVKNWIRQRSRWIKGYMQTYLVHMRHPVQFLRENGWHALVFQIVVGGKIGFMFINPFLWIATILYFTAYALVGPTLETLYPPLVFYFGAFSLVFGNFLYLYYYMIGTAKRGHFQVIKYVFLVPFYWLLVSWAAFIGLYQLIRKPHYWEKTLHGLHLKESSPVPHQAQASALILRPTQPSLTARFKYWRDELIEFAPRFIPKSWLEFALSNKGALLAFMVFGNFFNFCFNAFLGRTLSFTELNLVVFVNTVWLIVGIVMSGFSVTVNHRVAYLRARKGKEAGDRFFTRQLGQALVFAVLASLLLFLAAPIVARFFQVADPLVLSLFTPAILFGLLSYAFQGFLNGCLRFFASAVILLTEAFSKLFWAVLFVFIGQPDNAYLSIPLSLATASLVGGVLLWRLMRAKSTADAPAVPSASMGSSLRFPFPFFFSSMAAGVSTTVFLSVDILLVKHFFPAETAGQYALLSLTGKMVYFLGSLPMVFLVPLVSRNDGLKRPSRRVLIATLSAVAALSGVAVVAFGFLGFVTAPFLFGPKASAIIHSLPLYTFSIALFTLSNVLVVYHLAKRHYSFSLASLAIALAMALGIWLNHDEFADIVTVIFASSLIGTGVLASMHLIETALPFIGRGFRDLWGIFINGLPKAIPRVATGKRILIMNWRDTTHAYAGGAEVYIHEMAKAWVAEGHHVTLFCGNDGQQPRYSVVDGVNVVRRGGFYLVYLWAPLYYFFRFRGRYDVVIDCENGIPFFTPLYVGVPIFCLMHHVHQDVFFRSLPKPLALLASTLEKDLMPLVYSKVPFITVSESSREEMQELGIGRAGITVVHPGVDATEFAKTIIEKTMHPTILYLGRLKAYKSVNILIQAFRLVLSERPEAKLIIAGDGDERESLERLAKELRFAPGQVQFLGAVSHTDKVRLLQSSWMLVNPSFMEGWGIVVIEANACGTPVIASDVPGLRDSVKHADTGYLVPYGDVKMFADRILTVIRDTRVREALSSEALVWAKRFDWAKSGQAFLGVIDRTE